MTGSRSALLWAGGLLFIAVPLSAPAEARGNDDSVALGACIRRAAHGRPWLEKTLWGLRDQEGGWVGAAILNSDGSHDLGPLQVNSWWVARISQTIGKPEPQVRQWLIHDACFNVDVARWIFLSGLAATRDYWRAVGIYHSPTPWRQRRYARLVASQLTYRFGPSVFAPGGTEVWQR